MGWEWGQLQLIRELADRGSVTAVETYNEDVATDDFDALAAATHRTPSAVSQQLKAIQRQAGVPLVERVGRGLRLTDAGRALAASAGGVATALAEADAAWDDYLGTVSGTVRLATFFSAGELLVPGLVERLAGYPELTLVVDYDLVAAHRPDDTERAPSREVRVTPLYREPLDVAVALDHPLAGRRQVEPAELVGEAWIAPPPEFPIEQAVRALAARAGAPARIVRRTTHLPLMEGLVARGQGIALLPRYSTQEHAAGRFALLPVTGIRAGRLIEVLSRPERAARRAVRVVLAALQAEADRVARGGAAPG